MGPGVAAKPALGTRTSPCRWRRLKAIVHRQLMGWPFNSVCRVLSPDSDISSRDRMLRRRAQGNPHAEGLAAKFGTRTYEGWLGSTI
jgi:hypothetical protein